MREVTGNEAARQANSSHEYGESQPRRQLYNAGNEIITDKYNRQI